MELEQHQPHQPPLSGHDELGPGRAQQAAIARAVARATMAIMGVHNRDITVDERREIQQAWGSN
eukprot:4097978-Pyramimonas_sp.AAC.1